MSPAVDHHPDFVWELSANAVVVEGGQEAHDAFGHLGRCVCEIQMLRGVALGGRTCFPEFDGPSKVWVGRVVYRASRADWPLGDPAARGRRSRLWTESLFFHPRTSAILRAWTFLENIDQS